jgi:predicted peptidase
MSHHLDFFEAKTHIRNSDTLKYRIMLPRDFSEEQSYPVILVLHGAGERGDDNEKQLVHGSKLLASEKVRDSFPAIVIFPQCPTDDYWSKVDVDRSSFPIKLDFKYTTGPTKSMTLVMDLMDKMTSESFVKKISILK